LVLASFSETEGMDSASAIQFLNALKDKGEPVSEGELISASSTILIRCFCSKE
jgi:hypothetical protein